MKTIIELDDELVFKASAAADVKQLSELLHEGLRSLIYQRAAQELAKMGGSQPEMKDVPRRRTAA